MILDFLLPAPCVVCGRLPKPICQDCTPKSQLGQESFENLKICFAGTLDCEIEILLKNYKDKHRMALEKTLSTFMSDAVNLALSQQKFDWYAVPPRNAKNFKRRGFSPVTRLVRRTKLAEMKRIPLRANRNLVDQRSLAFPARQSNTELAFTAPLGRGRVLLVDDVMTTGATIREMARCLRSAGYEASFGCVLARRMANSS